MKPISQVHKGHSRCLRTELGVGWVCDCGSWALEHIERVAHFSSRCIPASSPRPDAELSYVRAIFDAALKGGTANVIGPIDTPHEFIFIPDVAETLIALSEKEEAYGKAWNVAGPGLMTTRQFAEQVFGAVHQKPRLRVAGSKVMLRVLGRFNPFLREVVEMHYLWTTPVKLDDTRLRQLLPNLHKTPYTEGIRATIDAMRTRAVPAVA